MLDKLMFQRKLMQGIRIILDFTKQDPSLLVRIRILSSSTKNSKKNLDSYCFVILYDFLSLKNNVNAPSNVICN
jgi:hypothetical protein